MRGFTIYHSRLPLLEKLTNKGYEVVALGCEDKYSQKIREIGIPFIDIPFYQGGFNLYNDSKTICLLNKLYRKHKPTYVHHFNTKPVFFGSLAAQYNKVDHIFNTMTGLGYVFVDDHNFMRKLLSLGYAKVLSKSDMVIFQNPDDMDLFLKNSWIERKKAALIISSGVDLQKFKPKQRYNEEKKIKILMVSRLIWQKGVKEYIEAANICTNKRDNLSFFLGGELVENHTDGISKEWIMENTRKNNINFLGYIHDMPTVLKEMDLFVFPSFYREGVPRVLIEAAATGIPIITTDTPGCKEVIREKVNGLLIKEKNSYELADAIIDLTSNPSQLKEMGCNSRKIAVEYFDIDNISQKYIELYEE